MSYQPLPSHVSYDCGMLSPRSTMRRTPSECGDGRPRDMTIEMFAHATDGWYTVGLATPPPHLHAASAAARFDFQHATLMNSAMSSPAMLPSPAVVGAADAQSDDDEYDEDEDLYGDGAQARRSSLPEPLEAKDEQRGSTVDERIRIMEERTKLVRRRHASRMAAGRSSSGSSSSGSSTAGKAKPTCRECNKTFSRKHNLHQHTMRMHNPDRQKLHICEHCEKPFDRQADLNRHLDSVSTQCSSWPR
jgi:hypothetical protein